MQEQQTDIKLNNNQIAIATLLQQGVKQADIARQLNLTTGYVSIVKTKLSKIKYDITSPRFLKPATRVILNTLNAVPIVQDKTTVSKAGEVITYQDNIYPSHTNILTAAAMVVDRHQPIVTHTVTSSQSLNINVELDKMYPDYDVAVDNHNQDVVDVSSGSSVHDNNIQDVSSVKPKQLSKSAYRDKLIADNATRRGRGENKE